MQAPEQRLTVLNDREVETDRDFVLYWMTAQRRVDHNFAFEHAVAQAEEFAKPLVVLEPLRIGYRWASDRLHAFVIAGMADNAERLADTPVRYYPYLEPEDGAGRGLLEALAKRACLIVADDYPSFFLPRMLKAASKKVDARFEAVDGNGLMPLRVPDRTFPRAHSYRRFLQKNLTPFLDEMPAADPLAGADLEEAPDLDDVADRWAAATAEQLEDPAAAAADLPIDHDVPAVSMPGGARAAAAALERFIDERLGGYDDGRNHPAEEAASGLSPYLHFGHVGAHQVFRAVVEAESWSPNDLSDRTDGSRSGWWGMGEDAEAFLDQLVTWRELGFNMTHREDDYERYASLPDWARKTLEEHEDDDREYVYDLDTFAAAETHDEIWNAAQRQLARDGVMHNYLRMLWGKKILEWTKTPREALEVMIELNNRFALDGRDPNSTSGIFWTLGRYDRAWGPERPVFGKIRFMSSANTKRKLKLGDYLERYAAD